MTAVRIPIQEYASRYGLSAKLTEAINACYISQNVNPEAMIARKFMKLGFKNVIDSVRVGNGFSDSDHNNEPITTFELVVNGRGCGEKMLPAGETCSKEELSQALRGKNIDHQQEVDDCLAESFFRSSVRSALSMACLEASVSVSGTRLHESIINLQTQSDVGNDARNDYSQFFMPHPVMWMLTSDTNKLTVGLTDTSTRPMNDKIHNFYKILNHIRSSNSGSFYENASGVLVFKTPKTAEDLLDAINSAAKEKTENDTPQFETSEVGICLHSTGCDLSVAVSYQERSGDLAIKYIQDGFDTTNGEVQQASRQLYGPPEHTPKTLIGCFCDSQSTMKSLLDTHYCQVGVFDPTKFGTLTSLVAATKEWRSGDGSPPICVESNPHVAVGVSAVFFAANPSPAAWNALISIGNDAGQDGCLVPTPVLPLEIPLPDSPSPSPSPPEAQSRKPSKAAKKK
eukprot:TRINITY_DN16282_c0_g1_i1.p1 TRINITY_DN16282_c0_g1~~TRINITY_DN16282_c0_g1_i1.p1  ORF type:complete len:456 (+),score=94.91 TRINITY_DN16282_c0_g1_i1:37-1404(+)